MSASIDFDNLNMLKELLGQDLKDILDVFLQSTPDLLTQLNQAVETQDSDTVRSLAHTLKGSAANVGANQLSSLSAELEKLGLQAETTQFATKFAEIKTASDESISALKDYIQQNLA